MGSRNQTAQLSNFSSVTFPRNLAAVLHLERSSAYERPHTGGGMTCPPLTPPLMGGDAPAAGSLARLLAFTQGLQGKYPGAEGVEQKRRRGAEDGDGAAPSAGAGSTAQAPCKKARQAALQPDLPPAGSSEGVATPARCWKPSQPLAKRARHASPDGTADADVAAPDTGKPSVCVFFLRGNCRSGTRCAFSHERGGSTKPEDAVPLCKFHSSKVGCTFGDRCHFRHTESNSWSFIVSSSSGICREFEEYGQCQYGKDCNFAHRTAVDQMNRPQYWHQKHVLDMAVTRTRHRHSENTIALRRAEASADVPEILRLLLEDNRDHSHRHDDKDRMMFETSAVRTLVELLKATDGSRDLAELMSTAEEQMSKQSLRKLKNCKKNKDSCKREINVFRRGFVEFRKHHRWFAKRQELFSVEATDDGEVVRLPMAWNNWLWTVPVDVGRCHPVDVVVAHRPSPIKPHNLKEQDAPTSWLVSAIETHRAIIAAHTDRFVADCDIVVVLDVSSSMAGSKIDAAKAGIQSIISDEKLGPESTLTLWAFSDSGTQLLPKTRMAAIGPVLHQLHHDVQQLVNSNLAAASFIQTGGGRKAFTDTVHRAKLEIKAGQRQRQRQSQRQRQRQGNWRDGKLASRSDLVEAAKLKANFAKSRPVWLVVLGDGDGGDHCSRHVSCDCDIQSKARLALDLANPGLWTNQKKDCFNFVGIAVGAAAEAYLEPLCRPACCSLVVADGAAGISATIGSVIDRINGVKAVAHDKRAAVRQPSPLISSEARVRLRQQVAEKVRELPATSKADAFMQMKLMRSRLELLQKQLEKKGADAKAADGKKDDEEGYVRDATDGDAPVDMAKVDWLLNERNKYRRVQDFGNADKVKAIPESGRGIEDGLKEAREEALEEALSKL